MNDLEGWKWMLVLDFLLIFNSYTEGYLLSLIFKSYNLLWSYLTVESWNRAIGVDLVQKPMSKSSHYLPVFDLRVGSDFFESAHLYSSSKIYSGQVSSFLFESARMDYAELSNSTRVGSFLFESTRMDCIELFNSTWVGSSLFELAWKNCPTIFYSARVDSSYIK